MLPSCVCSNYSLPLDLDEQITAFYQLRSNCPALYQVTIPDDLTERHLNFLRAEPDTAYHCSVPFLAYCRGRLPDFTEPLHRYVLNGTVIRDKVNAQYRKELREDWLLKSDEVSRFKQARRYLSRLAELHFARWLETQQWQILNLELYGGKFDVEAVKQHHFTASFEIKFLAQREVLFELNRASFHNPTTVSLGVYSPSDYLLFRIYEAARKLRNGGTRRIAVAIVSDYDVSYKIPLSKGWINWKTPRFFQRDPEIQDFLYKEYTKNSNLDNDLISFIMALNEIWILRYKNTFDLYLEHQILIS